MVKLNPIKAVETLRAKTVELIQIQNSGMYNKNRIGVKVLVHDKRLEEALGYTHALSFQLGVYLSSRYTRRTPEAERTISGQRYKDIITGDLRSHVKALTVFFVPDATDKSIPWMLTGLPTRKALKQLLRASIVLLSEVLVQRKDCWEDIFLSPLLNFLADVAYDISNLSEFSQTKLPNNIRDGSNVVKWLDRMDCAERKDSVPAVNSKQAPLHHRVAGFLRRALPELASARAVEIPPKTIFQYNRTLFYTTRGLSTEKGNLEDNLATATEVIIY